MQSQKEDLKLYHLLDWLLMEFCQYGCDVIKFCLSPLIASIQLHFGQPEVGSVMKVAVHEQFPQLFKFCLSLMFISIVIAAGSNLYIGMKF